MFLWFCLFVQWRAFMLLFLLFMRWTNQGFGCDAVFAVYLIWWTLTCASVKQCLTCWSVLLAWIYLLSWGILLQLLLWWVDLVGDAAHFEVDLLLEDSGGDGRPFFILYFWRLLKVSIIWSISRGAIVISRFLGLGLALEGIQLIFQNLAIIPRIVPGRIARYFVGEYILVIIQLRLQMCAGLHHAWAGLRYSLHSNLAHGLLLIGTWSKVLLAALQTWWLADALLVPGGLFFFRNLDL